MNIGILAVQGAFFEHAQILKSLGVNCFEIRQLSDLTSHNLDKLIIPGGESTVIGKLITELNMLGPLKQMIQSGMPVLGTCAGLILLAKKIDGTEKVHLGTMNITAKRNAYGRQLGSFHIVSSFANLGEIPMTFIRAPYIEEVGQGVEVLAQVDSHIVAARQANMLVTSFHPELTGCTAVHEYFLKF